MPSSTPVRLVFDTKELRPMCALIQAMHTKDYVKVNHFNAESWLTAPTSTMVLVELTPENFERIVKAMNARFPRRQPGKKAR